MSATMEIIVGVVIIALAVVLFDLLMIITG